MPRTTWLAAIATTCLLTACGGGSGGSADKPAETVTVTKTAGSEPGSPSETSESSEGPSEFSAGSPVEFRVVIGSEFEPCGDPGASATGVPPTSAPSATGVPPIPTPDCDQQRLDSLDCDAPPAPSVPDEVIYACSEERAGEGDEPGTPSVRYALSPARIVGVRDAGYGIPQGGVRYSVMLSLDDEGTKELARLSTELTQGPSGDLFAIVLDGVVLSAPYFSSTITDGQAEISGDFTEDEARELAEAIKSAG